MQDDLSKLVSLMYEQGYSDPFEAEGGGVKDDATTQPKKAYIEYEREHDDDRYIHMYHASEWIPGPTHPYIGTYSSAALAIYHLVNKGYQTGFINERGTWQANHADWVKTQYDLGEQIQERTDRLLKPR